MRFQNRYIVISFLCLLLIFSLCPITAQDTPDSPYQAQQIAEGFSFVTAIVQPPDDSDRLFVADLKGKIYILEDGVVRENLFLDVSENLTTLSYGQGLLGMAFHPDYAENGFFFVDYTPPDGNAALVRYQVSADDPNLADPDSATTVFVIPHPTEFHYGGQLAFGPDGYLYWSMGDGATKRSPAPRLDSYLGSILRLDVTGGDPYQVPTDNPFVGREDALPELWAKGLRNPWRFSFDRHTGDLYIADVGEAAMEEIDFQPAGDPGGQNYGWNAYEGTYIFNNGSKDGLTFPVVEYSHEGGHCSITGGYVYRGTALPDLVGKYVFGDYCSGWLWTTYQKPDGTWYTAQLLKTNIRMTTFGEDNAGELYLGDARGRVYHLVAADS
jgi:glucose/arabinose dehydrogenase